MVSLIHWLQMGGYAAYVWSAYCLGALVLGFNVYSARKNHRQVGHFEK